MKPGNLHQQGAKSGGANRKMRKRGISHASDTGARLFSARKERNTDMTKRIFTSESVTEGHPDKVCDQISDGVLDAILAQDPQGRVACECATTTGLVLVMGEISTSCYVDIPKLPGRPSARSAMTSPECGFDGHTCAVLTAINEQSGDIAMGVNNSYDDAATNRRRRPGHDVRLRLRRDQGADARAHLLAHNLTSALTDVRASPAASAGCAPTARARCPCSTARTASVERIDTVVVSTQHSPDIAIGDLREAVIEEVIKPTSARPSDGRGHQISRQPHRPVRHRRPGGRQRPDGPQDHRGYLRRLCRPRRRRVLRQGSHEGGPQRRVYGPLHRQEHRRGGPREQVPD